MMILDVLEAMLIERYFHLPVLLLHPSQLNPSVINLILPGLPCYFTGHALIINLISPGLPCYFTGHAYAAAISACAAGGDWMRAVSLFEEMASNGVRPDVVSCTALVTALASSGESDKAEAVVKWMLRNKLKPNVRPLHIEC
jgi:pentatricopeptide repeat protein